MVRRTGAGHALTVATVYARDNGRCVFCGMGEDDGVALTIDHIVPRVWGGSELTVNMLTCCRPCNDQKGTADAEAFAEMVERYLPTLPKLARFAGLTAADIKARVKKARAQRVNYADGRRYLEIVRANRKGG